MKLLAKYNRINIITSILIFAGGCVAFYFVLNYVLLRQVDETLETEKAEIVKYINQRHVLPEIINTNDQQVYFLAVQVPVLHDIYSSEKKWNEHEQEKEWMRTLVFGVMIPGKYYRVTVQTSQEYQQSLLKLIILVTTVMIAAILLAGFIINRIVLKNLWQPFYHSINRVSGYQLQQGALELPVTGIDEFDLLNKSLGNMAARVEADYGMLKEFTGNAAHEMQTPLAVISANTESLIQDESLLLLHHQTIFSIEDAVKRLSRLNQSLLLLTKIENRRFELTEKIDWEVLLKERLNELQELLASKNVSVKLNTQPVSAVFHQQLADILLTNLISNALRYNVEAGAIDIELNSSRLVITNTSGLPALDTTKIFSRFYRHPLSKTEGSGLGLSIVKQICEMGGYSLLYQYSGNRHVFSVWFQ